MRVGIDEENKSILKERNLQLFFEIENKKNLVNKMEKGISRKNIDKSEKIVFEFENNVFLNISIKEKLNQ